MCPQLMFRQLVRTASFKNSLNQVVLACTHNQCLAQKKKIYIFENYHYNFINFKNRCILHRHVCMFSSFFLLEI